MLFCENVLIIQQINFIFKKRDDFNWVRKLKGCCGHKNPNLPLSFSILQQIVQHFQQQQYTRLHNKTKKQRKVHENIYLSIE